LLAVLPAAFTWEEKVGEALGVALAAPVAAVAVAAAVASQAAAAPAGYVVFSGVRDKEFEARLIAAGWAVEDSVTKKTTALVVSDEPAPETGKVKKARAAGVQILGLTAAKANLTPC
jgi:NAD-dependent DNA ligase